MTALNRPCGLFSPILGQPYSSPGVSTPTFGTQPLEFTIPALDGYGLRYLMLTRPAFSPVIQFLFVGSYLCSTLPSDPTSRWMPLRFSSLHLHQVGKGTLTLLVVVHAQHASCTTRIAGSMRKPPMKGVLGLPNDPLSSRVGFALLSSRALLGCECIRGSSLHPAPLYSRNILGPRNAAPRNCACDRTSGES